MSAYLPIVAGLTGTLIGAIPILWLIAIHFAGGDREPALWWLAAALFVSFFADALAAMGMGRVANDSYPVMQSALIGLVLLRERRDALRFVALLGTVALIAPAITGLVSRDLLLCSVAWLGVAGIVYQYRSLPRLLRWSLLMLFGWGWLAWLGYVLWPGWVWWLAYQGTRLLGSALFCWAALKPGPTLRLARA